MIQKKYNYRLVLLLFCGLFAFHANAAEYEETKTVVCNYATNSAPDVEISNRYGEVQMITWDKDSVRVEVTMKATSDKWDDMDRLLNMAEIEHRGTESSVLVSTEWSEGGFFRRGAMDIKNLFKADKKLIIDYKVYLPSKSRLTIENRFGDVYLPDFEGALRLNISHGDLRARDITNARSISVKYGKVVIKKLQKGLLKVEYGSLILEAADIMTLNSRSSKMEILEVNRLAIDSRNDELRIDAVNSLRGEMTFSHLRVKQVRQLVDLNTFYGDLSLRDIQIGFEMIRMQGNNTDYDLEFMEKSSYRFDVESEGNKAFDYDPEVTVSSEDIEDKTKVYKGYSGSEEALSLVNIRLKNGFIKFHHR